MSFQSRKHSDACLSDLVLDTLIAGDLAASEHERAQSHIGTCEPCRARWQVLAARSESTALPALNRERASAAATRVPSHRRRTLSAGLRWAGVAAAACCAFVLFQLVSPRDDTPLAERRKGAGRLGFFVQRGGEMLRGGPGELLHPGDTLQLTFFAPGPGYLVVLGRDASGKLAVYYPSSAHAARVEAGEQTLPESTLLDDTLGDETIEAVFCSTGHDVESLRVARERTRAVDGCALDTLRVVKAAR